MLWLGRGGRSVSKLFGTRNVDRGSTSGSRILAQRSIPASNRVKQDKVKLIVLQDLESRWDGRRNIPHTVLVDQPTDAARVRKALSYLACVGETNIIGMQ